MEATGPLHRRPAAYRNEGALAHPRGASQLRDSTGFPPDFPTWGRLLFDGTNFIQITPSRVIWPGLFIALTVLSVNYIGDGLRDALDPRMRGR